MTMVLQIAYYLHLNIQEKKVRSQISSLNWETITETVLRGAIFFLFYFDSGSLINKKADC